MIDRTKGILAAMKYLATRHKNLALFVGNEGVTLFDKRGMQYNFLGGYYTGSTIHYHKWTKKHLSEALEVPTTKTTTPDLVSNSPFTSTEW